MHELQPSTGRNTHVIVVHVPGLHLGSLSFVSAKQKYTASINHGNHVTITNKKDREKASIVRLSTLNRLFLCLCSFSESILKAAGHGLQVTHASGTVGSASLGLLSPVVLSHLLTGVSARRASRLLDVVAHLSASTATGVRLCVSLTERCRTLRL